MRAAGQVFFLVCLTFVLQTSGGKNDDENSPYEFGFTIDGQQHRHEKKDVNGIIQGEFGFITADGIYHVTVYATDENGNFKILSMRNVRVSPPLDGSGTPEQKQQQLQPYKAAPVPAPAPAQPPSPSPQAPPSTPAPVTTPKFNGFTTQSTIKPACASCGYVTTSATPKKFEFQSPAFSQGAGQAGSSGGVSAGQQGPASANYQQAPQQQQQQPQGPLSVNVPLEQNQPAAGQDFQSSYPGGGIPVPPQYYTEQKQVPQYSQGNQGPQYSQENQGPQYSQENQAAQYQQNQPPSQENQALQYPQGNQENQASSPENQPPQYSSNQNQVDSSGNAAASSSAGQSPSSRLSQVTVSNGAIHVPGNPDIPIQDKYPNMEDGLPNGIEEKDITDLLYKFNYTVGFHGHYEKGYRNGAKVGGYFVNGRDGISRVVTYVADENGYRPKVKLINLGLDSPDTPKEGTEKSFGLKHFEFVWYPVN